MKASKVTKEMKTLINGIPSEYKHFFNEETDNINELKSIFGILYSIGNDFNTDTVTLSRSQLFKRMGKEINSTDLTSIRSKLKDMKLVERVSDSKDGTIYKLLFKEESQEKEMKQEEQQAIEQRNIPMRSAKELDSSMIDIILQELDSLKQEISTLREDNRGLKQEISTLRESNVSLQDEIKDLKEDNSKLKQGMRTLQENFKFIKQEISTLRDSNNDTSTENTSISSGNASPVASNPQVMESSSKTEEKPLGKILEKIIEDVPQVEVQRLEKRNVEKDDRFSSDYLEKWYTVFNDEIPNSTEGLSQSAREEISGRFIKIFSNTLPQEEGMMILMTAIIEKYNKVHSGTKSKELLLKAISNANKAVGFNLHELLTNLPRKQELMEKFYKS